MHGHLNVKFLSNVYTCLQWHKANEYKCHYHVERVFQSHYSITEWYCAHGNRFLSFTYLYLGYPVVLFMQLRNGF